MSCTPGDVCAATGCTIIAEANEQMHTHEITPMRARGTIDRIMTPSSSHPG
jgi:hypothetical protein